MLQHPPLSYYIPHTFRANNLIFSNVLERKCEARVFSLDDSDLAKGAFADNPEEAEVIKVDFVGHTYGLAAGVAHCECKGGRCWAVFGNVVGSVRTCKECMSAFAFFNHRRGACLPPALLSMCAKAVEAVLCNVHKRGVPPRNIRTVIVLRTLRSAQLAAFVV